MPRAQRAFDEGRIYHIFNRVRADESPFIDGRLASRFVNLLRELIVRDEHTVFAWCLMRNHYHLVVRMGPVPLSRTLKSLQQRVTTFRNSLTESFGPLWQGRFHAKVVEDESYLLALIAYVHLNPIKAGLVESLADYPLSGHLELTHQRSPPIVAVDEVLSLYGPTKRTALATYQKALRAVRKTPWPIFDGQQLPTLAPTDMEVTEEFSLGGGPRVDELGRPTSRYRRRMAAEHWLAIAFEALSVTREEIAGRGRSKAVVRARELIGLVGVERYGVHVRELATALGKSEDGVGLWGRRGAKRRLMDPEFAEAANRLDELASEER